jgi:hypothetical protein
MVKSLWTKAIRISYCNVGGSIAGIVAFIPHINIHYVCPMSSQVYILKVSFGSAEYENLSLSAGVQLSSLFLFSKFAGMLTIIPAGILNKEVLNP